MLENIEVKSKRASRDLSITAMVEDWGKLVNTQKGVEDSKEERALSLSSFKLLTISMAFIEQKKHDGKVEEWKILLLLAIFFLKKKAID